MFTYIFVLAAEYLHEYYIDAPELSKALERAARLPHGDYAVYRLTRTGYMRLADRTIQ